MKNATAAGSSQSNISRVYNQANKIKSIVKPKHKWWKIKKTLFETKKSIIIGGYFVKFTTFFTKENAKSNTDKKTTDKEKDCTIKPI